jgi:diacylglycerol kinase (ATP)
MKRAFVIVNPGAGSCSLAAVRSALEEHFVPNGIAYEMHVTAEGEELSDSVRSRLGDGFDIVAAAGGDGTVSAVIGGLAGSSARLGIIPTGTANLVARELGIPLDCGDAAALIARAPRVRRLDAMRVGDRAYVLIIGVGISASVAGGTTKKNKGRFGLLAYVGAAFLKMFEFRPRSIEVVVDGDTHAVRSLEVAVANCGILADLLFPRGPEIHADDGRLDVCIVDARALFEYPRYLVRVLRRRPSTPRVRYLEARRSVVIRSARELPVQADGDVIGTTPVEITLLPGAVGAIAPEKPAAEPALHLARDLLMAQYLPNLLRTTRRR